MRHYAKIRDVIAFIMAMGLILFATFYASADTGAFSPSASGVEIGALSSISALSHISDRAPFA